ncbi:MAG: M1 family peptidase, partial [Oligoflexus sp.]|nr:M1 family peptidase [Pseudopedobacter sp.]
MLNLKFIGAFSIAICFLGFHSIAQTQASTTQTSNYDYVEAFKPFFYSQNGNTYRSAGGQPGHQYWQNRPDYQLTASLDNDANKITGSEILTYTNNSPDELGFIW